jgi:hypothetical protein
MSLRTFTAIVETMLPPVPFSEVSRTLTGAMATRDWAGQFVLVLQVATQAPPTMVMATSLTVAPSTAFLIALMSARDRLTPVNTR